MGFLSDLFGGGDSTSSNSSSSTNTNQTDRRIANDSGLVLQGDGNAFDTSTSWQNNDSSNRSTNWQNNDSSNRSLTNSGNSTTTTTNNVTDGGIAKGAFDTVTASQRVVGTSFTDLLTSATKIFTTASDNQTTNFTNLNRTALDNNRAALDVGASGLKDAYAGFGALVTSANKVLEGNAKSTMALGETVAQAYQTATAEKAGSLDNKTIVMLAAVAALALFIYKR